MTASAYDGIADAVRGEQPGYFSLEIHRQLIDAGKSARPP
jgi:hypothetical protein